MKHELSPEQIAILRWREGGPAQFAQELFGVEPHAWQWEASRALVAKRRVSVRSGHGVGKSALEAWTVLWYLMTHFPSKIPCTAPTAHQLYDILWAEISKWHQVMRERHGPLAAWIEKSSERVWLAQTPQEAFAVARTSRPEQPEALQGFHADNLLFVIDEASGVPDSVFEVAEGALSTPGAYVLMAGNPTRMSGYFYDSHHKMRESWATLRVNAEDVPTVSRDYIADMAKRYGTDSSIYRVRVLGEFAGTEDGVIPLELVEPAIKRDVVPFGDVVWGVDVARFGGDRTALAKRRGNALMEPITSWQGKDLMQTTGMLKAEYDAVHKKPVTIFVDSIGLGAGVVDRGRELGLPVVGVNVAESPSVGERYNRLRDELWFKAREWFAGRDVTMPEDEALVAELTLPSYKVLSSGKIQVESKDEMKRRGVTSPDLADAFCLTFAMGGGALKSKFAPIRYDTRGIV